MKENIFSFLFHSIVIDCSIINGTAGNGPCHIVYLTMVFSSLFRKQDDPIT